MDPSRRAVKTSNAQTGGMVVAPGCASKAEACELVRSPKTISAEMMNHECRMEFADSNIRELNRQIESQRVEIDNTITGYEQSKREQARRHEELAERGRALRETRIRSIHEMEEMMRAHELRVDVFSKRKIENQDTIIEVTARQELAT